MNIGICGSLPHRIKDEGHIFTIAVHTPARASIGDKGTNMGDNSIEIPKNDNIQTCVNLNKFIIYFIDIIFYIYLYVLVSGVSSFFLWHGF